MDKTPSNLQEINIDDILGTEPAGEMVTRVRESIKAAEHLFDLDIATVALAIQQATVIDKAFESGDPERIHRASCVPMPSLHKILTSLGLTPEGRQKLGMEFAAKEAEW